MRNYLDRPTTLFKNATIEFMELELNQGGDASEILLTCLVTVFVNLRTGFGLLNNKKFAFKGCKFILNRETGV